jgi:hypothetical protein
MQNHLFLAGIAVAALIPVAAVAQTTCEQRQTDRVVGTMAGAGIGALLGSAIAGHGDKTTGAVIGGVGGAIAGNQLSKGQADCAHAYGYYDKDSRWHANTVPAANAAGYYDRNGRWVAGAPNGHYDNQGRWIAVRSEGSPQGYYAAKDVWVPASASGYYNSDGRWVAAQASPASYHRGEWEGAPADLRSRESWLRARVQNGLTSGALPPSSGRLALHQIDRIARDDRALSHRRHGLSADDQVRLEARLDDVSANLEWTRRERTHGE